MTTDLRPRAFLPWALTGGFVLGTVDLLFAWLYWRGAGVSLQHILQSIGAGIFGKQSAHMGWYSAAMGLACHLLIATAMVVVYGLAARRWPTLVDRWVRYGAAYGLMLYAVMNLVVLPLSAAGLPSFANLAWVLSSVLMHILFGLGCAWWTRWIVGPRGARAPR